MRSTFLPGRWRHPAALALLVLAGACSSPAPIRLHTLLDSAPVTGRAPEALPVAIELAPVAVPPQVDQPQWLVRSADDSLLELEQDRWAAPLRDELRGALADRLARRWAAVDAAWQPPAPGVTVWRVRVDVLRLESLPGREARLEAAWTLSPSGGGAGSLACRSVQVEPVAPGTAALAQGHRRAVAALADAIGERLAALTRGEMPRCPG